MAVITINIPDAVAPRVTNAICVRHGYTTESGLTRPEFARRAVIEWIREVVRMHEAALAHAEAAAKAAADINPD